MGLKRQAVSKKQAEAKILLGQLTQLEELLKSMQDKLVSFREHLSVVQGADNLKQRVAPVINENPNNEESAWLEEARKLLEQLAAIGLKSAKESVQEPRHSKDTLRRALEEAIEEFYANWRNAFEPAREAIRKACEVLPERMAQSILDKVHSHFIASTCQAVEEALARVREFRETIEEEQARETPAGRRKRLDEFCEKHRCTYEDVCTSADVSRSSLYAWLNGKAPMVGARIELLLDGEIPSQKSGSS